MASYRVYFFDCSSRVVGLEILECEDDAAAQRAANALTKERNSKRAELWCRDRLIERFDRVHPA